MGKIKIYRQSCPYCKKVLRQDWGSRNTDGLPFLRCPYCEKIYRTGMSLPVPKDSDALLSDAKFAATTCACSLPVFFISMLISISYESIFAELVAVLSFFYLVISIILLFSSLFPQKKSSDPYIKLRVSDPELYQLNYREIIRVFPELSQAAYAPVSNPPSHSVQRKCNLVVKFYHIVLSHCTCALKEADINIDIASNQTFINELHALVYCITDFAVFAACGDQRSAIMDAVSNSLYSASQLDHILPRFYFYASKIDDSPLHAHCYMGSDKSPMEEPLNRCILAFCDCCLYPPYILNYDASSPVFSVLDVMKVSTGIYLPLADLLSEYYTTVVPLLFE